MAVESMENVKKWLNRGYRIYDNIKALEKAKQRAWEMATSTTPVLHERVQESHGNGTENKITAYLQYVNQIEQSKTKLFIVLSEIEDTIMRVEDNILRSLLTYRYLDFMTWENIAVEMNYSYMQVCRLHGKALQLIEDVIECYT